MNHIEQFVADSLFPPIKELRPRFLDISSVSGLTSVIIGMRRMGKTFRLFPISIFSRSLRLREVYPRNIYTIDPGLSLSVSSAGVSNFGSRVENCVFLTLQIRLRSVKIRSRNDFCCK